MKLKATAVLATALICLIPVAGLAQTSYTQDFEGLAQSDGALGADGWLVYGNIFDLGGTYLWGHGPWSAPNNQDPGNWCDIVDGQGGTDQDMQQLVVYSDYANAEQPINLIESNLFQEQVIPAGASGTWYFTFDGKRGDLAGAATAAAFIKILNPNAGWSATLYLQDMTTAPTTWTDYVISVDVTGLDGQILQFGFMSTTTNYDPCGVFYDNIAFTDDGSVANEDASWSDVKSLYK